MRPWPGDGPEQRWLVADPGARILGGRRLRPSRSSPLLLFSLGDRGLLFPGELRASASFGLGRSGRVTHGQ